MNADAVRAVLRRFKKDQYPLLLERWRFGRALGDTDISGPKHKIVRMLIGACLVRENVSLSIDLLEDVSVH